MRTITRISPDPITEIPQANGGSLEVVPEELAELAELPGYRAKRSQQERWTRIFFSVQW